MYIYTYTIQTFMNIYMFNALTYKYIPFGRRVSSHLLANTLFAILVYSLYLQIPALAACAKILSPTGHSLSGLSSSTLCSFSSLSLSLSLSVACARALSPTHWPPTVRSLYFSSLLPSPSLSLSLGVTRSFSPSGHSSLGVFSSSPLSTSLPLSLSIARTLSLSRSFSVARVHTHSLPLATHSLSFPSFLPPVSSPSLSLSLSISLSLALALSCPCHSLYHTRALSLPRTRRPSLPHTSLTQCPLLPCLCLSVLSVHDD